MQTSQVTRLSRIGPTLSTTDPYYKVALTGPIALFRMLQSSSGSSFALITTGTFSQNVGKLFSELELVTDNLLFIDHNNAQNILLHTCKGI